MTDREKIRAEIERQYEAFKAEYARTKGAYVAGRMDALDYIEQFIDSLPEESPSKGYDEVYLNKCIAKASKTWKGVDIDKYIDQVRGREASDLENAAEEFVGFDMYTGNLREYRIGIAAFIAGAEWQKRKMMEGAAEGRVISSDGITISALSSEIARRGLVEGDGLKIIIIKEDEK